MRDTGDVAAFGAGAFLIATKSNEVAKLSVAVPIKTGKGNLVDAAMAKVIPGDVSSALFGIGDISSTVAPPTMNLTVDKVGAGTAFTAGSITGLDENFNGVPFYTRTPIILNGNPPTVIRSGNPITVNFINQIYVTPGTFSAEGDSGALVVTGLSCSQPVGVVIGGISENGVPTTTVLNPISNVLTELAKAGGYKSLSIVSGGGCAAAKPNTAENLFQSPDAQAAEAATQTAEAARQRHLPDLVKIPHVVNMGIEFRHSQIIFNVQVDEEANVAQVEPMVPPKIEGYDVEVGAVPTGVLY